MPETEAEAQEVAEEAQTQAAEQAAPEETVEQKAQPESEAAETEGAEGQGTEQAEETPETVTLEEAEEMVKQAKAELESKWTEKLQANSQNAKLAEAIQSLSEHLSGNKPKDPNALPPGFDALPAELQQILLSQEQSIKKQNEMLQIIQRQQAERAAVDVVRTVDDVVHQFREDPEEGKLFMEVESLIAEDLNRNPQLREWVRQNPEEAIETLFRNHAYGRTQQVKSQMTQAKVQQAVKAASRPSQVSTSVETAPAKGAKVDWFEQAWNEVVGADVREIAPEQRGRRTG